MLEIISDTTKFEKLKIKQGKDYNYIINQEKRITEVLYDMTKRSVLNNDTYEKLKPMGSAPSVMYGLSKVHKTIVDRKPKQRRELQQV